MALEITDETINGLLAENEYALIDFWAEWCGPCRMLAPVIDELTKDNKDVLIAKLDVSNNPKSSAEFGITSIPCLVLLKNGVEVSRIKGAVPKSVIQKAIDGIKA
jgi:thioredoxin 1